MAEKKSKSAGRKLAGKESSSSKARPTPSVKKTSAAPAKAAPKASAAKKPAARLAGAPTKAAASARKAAVAPAPKRPGMEFIGMFPMRKNSDEKKADQKKQQTGPVFTHGDYIVGSRATPLAAAQVDEFVKTFVPKHAGDGLTAKVLRIGVDNNPQLLSNQAPNALRGIFTRELDEALLTGQIHIAVHDMRDIPVDGHPDIIVAAALRREDPRDALITRSTYGAIQELPTRARIGTSSKRCIMQIRAIRSDIELIPAWGTVSERLEMLDKGEVDAVIVPWASLRRLNLAPRYYVALQVEHMLPAPCQGIVGVTVRTGDENLLAKLRYIEDSEASWASRCERAFLQKLGGSWDAPAGAYAHRKGTQDPWILDTVVGDPRTGEILRHREIGTSRCKPESLADKAFTGIIAKGARKFLPFP
jgi:hydroxymethylbilane synthase